MVSQDSVRHKLHLLLAVSVISVNWEFSSSKLLGSLPITKTTGPVLNYPALLYTQAMHWVSLHGVWT